MAEYGIIDVPTTDSQFIGQTLPFTLSGFGGTPDAAIFVYTPFGASLAAFANTQHTINLAIADADNVRTICTYAFNTNQTSDTRRIRYHDAIIGRYRETSSTSFRNTIRRPTSPTPLFINNGVQLVFDNDAAQQATAGGHLRIFLFRGVSAYVDHIDTVASNAGPFSITGCPFTPKQGIVINGFTTAVNSIQNNMSYGFGAVQDDTPIQHAHASIVNRHAQASADQASGINRDYIQAQNFNLSPGVRYEVTSFNSDGISMSPVENQIATSFDWLLLDIGNDELELVDFAPNGTGQDQRAGTLDPVDAAIILQTSITGTGNTERPNTNPLSNHFSVNFGVRENGGGTAHTSGAAVHSADGAGSMNIYTTNQTSADEIIDHRAVTGTSGQANHNVNAFLNTAADWTGGGLNLDYQEADSNARGVFLLFKKGAAGPTPEKPTGTSTITGLTAGDVGGIHLPTGAGTLTGLTAGQAWAPLSPTGDADSTGLTAGNVLGVRKPSGDSELTGLTAGNVLGVRRPTGTGTLTGLTDGDATAQAQLTPTGTSIITGLTAGDVGGLALPTGTSTITGLTAGRVLPVGVNKPSGISSITGLTAGDVELNHLPTGTSAIQGLTSGQVLGAVKPTGVSAINGLTAGGILGARLPTGTSTLSGLTAGQVYAIVPLQPTGTSTLTGLTAGRVTVPVVGWVHAKRICAVQSEQRVCEVPSENRVCEIKEF